MTPAAIIEALMQGTGRRPLQPAGILGEGIAAGDDAAPARMLALAVQAQLHDLPAPPTVFDEVAAAPDMRPIVPEAVRPMILRLVTGKGNPPDDAAAFALAQGLERHGLRLHPFDVPRLAPFVRKHAEMLGIATGEGEGEAGAATAWALWETLDETNWMLATPARKAGFIADMRLADPAGARALVEAQLPLEKAEVRLRLIDALGSGLTSADRPFLESLAADRAPTVKRAVTRLLARLPGTGAAEAQIARLMTTGGSKGLRIGVPREYVVDGMPAEIQALWDQGVAWLKDAGCEIVEISLPHTKYALPTYYIVAPAEASSNLARYDGMRFGHRAEDFKSLDDLYATSRAEGFGKEVQRRLTIGAYVLSAGFYDAYYVKALKVRRRIAEDFDNVWGQVDAILTPSTPSAAFALGDKQIDPLTMYLNDVFTVTTNLAGLPGISVPAGVDAGGLPLGLQVIGKALDEATVFQVGAALERAAGFTAKPGKWW